MKSPLLKTMLALAAGLALSAPLSAETATIFANGDAYIRSDKTTANTNGDYRLLVGQIEGAGANDMRAVLSFDLSGLPADAVVTAVKLRLRVQENDTSPTNARTTLTLNLHALTEGWSEKTVSWANASAGAPWATPGGTLHGTVLSSATIPTTGRTPASYTWESSAALVGVVQAARTINSPVNLLIKSADETPEAREVVRFISCDEVGRSLQVYRPQLIVEYSRRGIPEASTVSALLGCAGLLAAGFLVRFKR